MYALAGVQYLGAEFAPSYGLVHVFRADEVKQLRNKHMGYRKKAWKDREVIVCVCVCVHVCMYLCDVGTRLGRTER